MKDTKKASLLGFVALPEAIIIRLIFDLTFERDLLFGLFKSISLGLVMGITWMVLYNRMQSKKKEKNRKKEN